MHVPRLPLRFAACCVLLAAQAAVAACGGRTTSVPPRDGDDGGATLPDGNILPDPYPLDTGLPDVEEPPDSAPTPKPPPLDGGEPDSQLPPEACTATVNGMATCVWVAVFQVNPDNCVNSAESSEQICANLCGTNQNGVSANRCYVGSGDVVDCYADDDPECGGGEPGPGPQPGG